jgi:hypothetical protein
MVRHINISHPNKTGAEANAAFHTQCYVNCSICNMICKAGGLQKHRRTHDLGAQAGAQMAAMAQMAAEEQVAIQPAIVAPAAIEAGGDIEEQQQGEEAAPGAGAGAGAEEIAAAAEGEALVPAVELGAAVAAIAALPAALPAAPGAVVPGPVAAMSLGDLIGSFRQGCFKLGKGEEKMTTELAQEMTEQAAHPEPETALQGIAALQLLPGLISYCRAQVDGTMRPIEFLRCVSAHPNKGAEIIRWARLWSRTRADRVDDRGEATAESLRRRAEACIRDGRLSLATTTLAELDNMKKGIPPPVRKTTEQIMAKIEELHPRGDAEDVLPEEAGDPAIQACIRVTPQQVQSKCRTLNKDSGSGNTGWTNSLLRALGDDRDFTQPHFNIG